MALAQDIAGEVDAFLDASQFAAHGAVVTDLDGTAVHEFEGRVQVVSKVELALKRLRDQGRPVVINTLRFPLSVMRTFGRAWFEITGGAVPTVCLNGSLIGELVEESDGVPGFREYDAFPLEPAEIEGALATVGTLLGGGVVDVIVFHYPRQWQKGEIIWTPDPRRVRLLADKYRSASEVVSGTIESLRERLLAEPMCMLFVLVEVPQDHLMAYQHTRRDNFYTRRGVDKRFGARAIAQRLSTRPEDSVGAGDTELDTFLGDVGLSVHVGHPKLPFAGLKRTVRLPDSGTFGDLLLRVAERMPAST